VLQTKEHALTPSPFVVFTFGLVVESIKELGGASISMLVVRLAFKIDVLKMEHAFQMGYREGDKMFYVFFTNWQKEEKFVVDHIHHWDDHWKVIMNASFEEVLNTNGYLQGFSGRIFSVWDDNH
jgi:hypothetical protein